MIRRFLDCPTEPEVSFQIAKVFDSVTNFDLFLWPKLGEMCHIINSVNAGILKKETVQIATLALKVNKVGNTDF